MNEGARQANEAWYQREQLGYLKRIETLLELLVNANPEIAQARQIVAQQEFLIRTGVQPPLQVRG